MRFFEFGGDTNLEIDKFVMLLRNIIGRSSSQKASAKLNWDGLNAMLQKNGFEIMADYETFKAMYDASLTIQSMVKDFNDKGIELKVPGSPADKNPSGPQDSQAEVDKIAAAAAPQQLAQQA